MSIKKRVLCLDDDADTCVLVALILQGLGHDVVSCSTILEASGLVEEESFDLLIVNERLPDGKGIDFCRAVRGSGYKGPVIIHSAAAYKEDIDRAMQAGANDYLIKPYGLMKLPEAVGKLLGIPDATV